MAPAPDAIGRDFIVNRNESVALGAGEGGARRVVDVAFEPADGSGSVALVCEFKDARFSRGAQGVQLGPIDDLCVGGRE